MLDVCVANYHDGKDTIKTALRDAWQRKKRLREGAMAAQGPYDGMPQGEVKFGEENNAEKGVV